MGRARSEVKERERAGPQEEWAGGLGWERGLGFFFSFLFQILFNTNLLHLFNSNFQKISQTFSQLFLRLFHKYFKTFKTTPQPKSDAYQNDAQTLG
jgi:hypothetical protein